MENKNLTAQSYASLPGQTATTADGTVYYQLEGPPEGRLLVLVHGMTLPSFIWDPTAEALTEAGFRVLRYDLFGRGYSERPRKTHNQGFYARQLLQLLEKLGLDGEAFDLAGFSMGAGIAAAYAMQYPEQVRRLILFDPLYPDDMPAPPAKIWKFLLRFRPMALTINNQIVDNLGNNFHDYEAFPDFEEQFYDQLLYKGYALAVTSSLIDFEFYKLPEIYKALGQSKLPIALFWGEEDQQAFFENNEKFKEMMPGLSFYPIPDAGHLSFYEGADRVNPLLVEFLNQS